MSKKVIEFPHPVLGTLTREEKEILASAHPEARDIATYLVLRGRAVQALKTLGSAQMIADAVVGVCNEIEHRVGKHGMLGDVLMHLNTSYNSIHDNHTEALP